MILSFMRLQQQPHEYFRRWRMHILNLAICSSHNECLYLHTFTLFVGSFRERKIPTSCLYNIILIIGKLHVCLIMMQ